MIRSFRERLATRALGAPAPSAPRPSAPLPSAPLPSAPLPSPAPGGPPPTARPPVPQAPSLAELEARLARAEEDLRGVQRRAEIEIGRLDWALGSIEGIVAGIDAYHAARQSPDYSIPFEIDEPLVSVCIATMDRAELVVERAVRSVLDQTYTNLQVVVVGDDCRDDTATRLAALGDARVEFVNLPERGPYPRAGIDRWRVAGSNPSNRALAIARGHFITHLDDDDSMLPERIGMLLAAAREDRADFLWHAFWNEGPALGQWTMVGNAKLELTKVTTSSVFYHRYFATIPMDLFAYRLGEPADWNRIRKIKLLRPRLRYVDTPLVHHFRQHSQAPLVARDGERFLE